MHKPLQNNEKLAISSDELESVMRLVYEKIISDPLSWIGSDKSVYLKKRLSLKGMSYYWEEKEEFEICEALKKVSKIVEFKEYDLI